MKIPVRELRYNFDEQKDTLFDTDISANLRQDTVAVLSIVTQCDSNVELGDPVKTMDIAGFGHYTMEGDFSSGDATGKIRYFWTVRNENPQFYDVTKIQMKFGDQGWSEMDYSDDKMFMDRVTQEYQLFVKANRNVPKKFEAIEAKLDTLRKLQVSGKAHEEIMRVTGEISAILGNAHGGPDTVNLATKEF